MDTLIKDLKFAVRRLVKSPGFTFIAVLSLALGIGANTAIFSLVNTVVFRSLPIEKPEEVYSVGVHGPNDTTLTFSYPYYVDFRDRNEVLSGIAVHRFAPVSLSRDGQNERVWSYLVSGEYFEMLGVRAQRGRLITPQDNLDKLAHPVAVISHASWQNRFGGDPSIIGKDVLINGKNFRIIGIAQEGFRGTEVIFTPEIWVPMMMLSWIEPGANWLDNRDTMNIFATARLKPGISREKAEASLNLLAGQLGKEYPDSNEGITIKLNPPGFIIGFLRDGIVRFSIVLMVTVGLVLLIACTNLASLLLARATDRRREIAIRLAIGASRGRLIRQLLTESVVLALVGGVCGLFLATWIIDLVIAFKPPVDFPLTFDLQIDWRVMLFALAVSGLTGIFFGLIPALQATRPELIPALKDETRTGGYRRSRLRSGLVVAQIALSLILLIASGLVLRALQQVQTLNPGFKVENGLVMSFNTALQGYEAEQSEQFNRQLIERVRALPGIANASFTDWLPLTLNMSSSGVYIEGQSAERGANVPTSYQSSVGFGYFQTMVIPILAGRDCSESDTKDSIRVVIVNEAFARRFFGGSNPVQTALDRRFSTDGPNGRKYQIVGVAGDGKYFNLGEAPHPFMYFPLSQEERDNLTLVLRTSSDPAGMIGAVRGVFRQLDANLPVYDIMTMQEHMGFSLFPARVAATLLAAFGLLALTLAAIGIYGVMAYSVAQRTREIGIRMALGAGRGDVLRLVLRHGVLLAMVGLVIGLAVSLAVTRLMSSVLYGVSATDLIAYGGVSIFLLVVVLIAVFIPARRASQVDPMIALRYE
ncbi:MAG: ABC transporter permease [Acidobacteriota bacterium]|nr:MAG: ABC transporter permease [Acidobacteriota bacterium]